MINALYDVNQVLLLLFQDHTHAFLNIHSIGPSQNCFQNILKVVLVLHYCISSAKLPRGCSDHYQPNVLSPSFPSPLTLMKGGKLGLKVRKMECSNHLSSHCTPLPRFNEGSGIRSKRGNDILDRPHTFTLSRNKRIIGCSDLHSPLTYTNKGIKPRGIGCSTTPPYCLNPSEEAVTGEGTEKGQGLETRTKIGEMGCSYHLSLSPSVPSPIH